ncbi:S-layer homology domain-containing protein [Bacillus cereus]|nr:S-layer homology domain-containing protein [Bacillus cereus]MEB8914905.1 S-layer homology domain-containing protein [Bacillus cereus]MEB8991864.1 S-layer homology domain-containing protein [Bacillus cereus]MEB9054182.1 S-layer homology domain-containing protein [Bacillus cereus]MEB9096203.1 S-layer homology domain-containing protein [Bacillus cereus]
MANKFLKTATALTIMGTSLLGAGAFTAKADNTDSLKFNDVPANHWSTKAIYDLTNRKVVQGYGNNIFGFGDNVTRGQVARMIYMYVKPADADANFKNPFTDIKGHLFEKEILALAKAGLVNGFGDGKYGPDDILTREQMAQVLTNAFKFKATKTTKFADVDKNSWSYGAISALEENGVTIGTGGNMYSPTMSVTREAYSQFLYNSINAVEKETKPEVKPDPKPEVKPDPKPEVPKGFDPELVQPGFEYYPEALESLYAQPHFTPEAQSILKEINKKYSTNLRYKDLLGSVHIMDDGMYYPEGSYVGGQFVVGGKKDDFKIIFLDNNPATVELTKRWVTYLTGMNLDREIDETKQEDSINNYEKAGYKIRVGQSMSKDMMYVQIKGN